jgi:hypothetical protein
VSHPASSDGEAVPSTSNPEKPYLNPVVNPVNDLATFDIEMGRHASIQPLRWRNWTVCSIQLDGNECNPHREIVFPAMTNSRMTQTRLNKERVKKVYKLNHSV